MNKPKMINMKEYGLFGQYLRCLMMTTNKNVIVTRLRNDIYVEIPTPTDKISPCVYVQISSWELVKLMDIHNVSIVDGAYTPHRPLLISTDTTEKMLIEIQNRISIWGPA